MRIKLSRRSIMRMVATITAALVALYAAATARAESMIGRINNAASALLSLDRQMAGRLTRTAVPDFMYLEYRSLYLELRPSVAAWRSRGTRDPAVAVAVRSRGTRDPTGAVRPASGPCQTAATARRRHSRRGSGLKGKRTERMVEQLAEFTAWLRGNPINERNPVRTVGARASLFWRLNEKTYKRDALRVGEKRGFGSGKTLASAFRNSKA